MDATAQKGGDGSAKAPFATIQQAAEVAVAGVPKGLRDNDRSTKAIESGNFNRQDAKYAKFHRRCLSAGGNIEFVGLGDLGVLAVGQIVKLQEKTMGA